MQASGVHRFQWWEQTFHLHPFRAIFWEERSALLIADLHLGKARHFRRNGLPAPQGVSDANWDRLISLLLDFDPGEVLFLGDLFHSDYNREWDSLRQLTGQFPDVSFALIPGNHDRLEESLYQDARLTIHSEPFAAGPFLLSHHPMDDIPEGCYNLAGHIHPSVRLRGGGRQRLRLPCFYFGERQGILPAFGAFTGTATVNVKNGDQVFVIAEDMVVALSA